MINYPRSKLSYFNLWKRQWRPEVTNHWDQKQIIKSRRCSLIYLTIYDLHGRPGKKEKKELAGHECQASRQKAMGHIDTSPSNGYSLSQMITRGVVTSESPARFPGIMTQACPLSRHSTHFTAKSDSLIPLTTVTRCSKTDMKKGGSPESLAGVSYHVGPLPASVWMRYGRVAFGERMIYPCQLSLVSN